MSDDVATEPEVAVDDTVARSFMCPLMSGGFPVQANPEAGRIELGLPSDEPERVISSSVMCAGAICSLFDPDESACSILVANRVTAVAQRALVTGMENMLQGMEALCVGLLEQGPHPDDAGADENEGNADDA